VARKTVQFFNIYTKVNARKNSEYKTKTVLAFTPGYAVNLIDFYSKNKPYNT
jgi:hypothetical protein